MLSHLPLAQSRFVLAALAVWLIGSGVSFYLKDAVFFAAMGSFSLSISFVVFLTDRYATQESRRYWDSEILTQSRMMWRYFQNIEQNNKANDPTPPNVLRDQITDNFDALLAAKAAERGLEKFRTELSLTIIGTLQWGFGGMLVKYIFGEG